ncbi:hypothetical protein Tsubulata_012486 [Turnera subulata]|uniref:Cytochrome c oxidase subunit n=1 Tax=Turnera subulata TaxID=218843 RepID=A0A9Q0GK20_9ROSI|nr:hypothetical protein Tsubulata_012486 [Turnera subulata]
MAEAAAAASTPPSLHQDYHLKEKEEKADVGSKAEEVKQAEAPPAVFVSEEAATVEKAEETPAAAAAEEKPEADSAAAGDSTDDATASAESNEPAQEENSGEEEAEEDKPEIKLETAPADYRFPTTNQTRHCFTRYIEYHRCTAAKGEGAPECDKFAKYYRSLCPTEWVQKWNEQRENGTFPGPL